MKKILYLSFFILSSFNMLFSQNLAVQNPSFEGPLGPHITPPLWGICMPGCTPDTQPGIWGVSLPPSDGSSYIGMCHQQSSSWQEGASQELLDSLTGNSEPMQAGGTYHFGDHVSVGEDSKSKEKDGNNNSVQLQLQESGPFSPTVSPIHKNQSESPMHNNHHQLHHQVQQQSSNNHQYGNINHGNNVQDI